MAIEMPSDLLSGNNIVSTDRTIQSNTFNTLGDRGVDLSMISSDMLGGIEVTKAITPDMDATAFGGVVNFDLPRAANLTNNLGLSWLPSISISVQNGYEKLKDNYGNYKFSGVLEKRFFDQNFGVLVMASAENRNLSDNSLGANYTLNDKSHGDAGIPDLSSLSLNDYYRIRKRYGGTLVLDYQHKTGSIGFMNILSSSQTTVDNRGESISATANNIYYNANATNNKLNIITNLIAIKQDIPIFHVDLKLSNSYTESRNPQDLFFNFYQDNAGLANKGNLSKVYPTVLAADIVPNAANASLDQIQTYSTYSKENSSTVSIDLKTNVTLSDLLSSGIKFGGMYQYHSRYYDYNQSSGSQLYSGGAGVIGAFTTAYPNLVLNGGRLSFVNFNNDSYGYGNFLDGQYSLPYRIDINLMRKLLPLARVTSTLEGYQVNKLQSTINDYSGNEKKSALYAMLTFKIGDQFTILPGARYQNLTSSYTALRAESAPGTQGYIGRDSTITKSHGFLLPMVHVRYKPLDWLQVHFAYTNTLYYPDYSAITPRYFIGPGYVDYNNVNLKPSTSENFDLIVSVYSNEVGLFSIDGFTKKIKDLIFPSNKYVTNFKDYPDLPQGRTQLYEFNTYINNPLAIDVRGIEAEWQTNLWYLPFPFSGLVLTVNYTHIFSSANYPKSTVNTVYNEDGTFKQTIVDTFYTSRLLLQPNDIANLQIGYDYKGFSARASMLYLDNVFKLPDFWMQNRQNTAKSTRWDFSVKQDLPWYGIQLYFNMNNIS